MENIPLEEFQRVILEENPLERENILQEIVQKYQVMYVKVLGKLYELLGEENYQRIMNGKEMKKEIKDIKEDIKDIKEDVKDVQQTQETVKESVQDVKEVVKEAVKEAMEEVKIAEVEKESTAKLQPNQEDVTESAVVETKIQTQEKDLVKRVDFHDLRFCKIRRGTKKPYEADWPHKPYTWAEMQEHIKKELNYGVQCGYEGLIVIDADSKEVRDIVEKELPVTFKVETGSKGFHYYFICKEVKKKVVLQTDKHYGEIQSTGTQVVGPGSLHPNGNYYTVINDIALAELTKEQLFSAMKPFMKDVAEEEARALEELKEQNKKYAQDSDINSIAITSVLSLGGFRKSNKGEYFGTNPWHGSSTGMNFWINPSKNVAKCWRCDCGLNVAKVIALENHIISTCSEKLTKSQFMEVLKIAQEKHGLVKMESQYQRSGNPNISKVINSFFDKEDLAEQIYNVQPYFYDKVKNWWLWNHNDKCWARVDETDILNMTNLNSIADTIKAKERVEILEAMKQEGRRRIPQPVKPTWIQFKDTIVDVAEGTKMTATPDYFVTNPIPWALHNDNCEDTPNMDRIFVEWVGEDFYLLLFQILAFCLLPDYPINRLFCFIGPGMNGKTKYLELLGKFVGKNNITSTELDILLDSRFEISRLHKKLVCVMGETNFAEMSKTSIIKKLTGGDLIGFEYKGKDPFDDKNYAKVLISTNNLPTTTDKTIGFYRRWLIVDFPNQFTEKIDILSQIPEEEYNCLANKCIKILKALLIDRKFHKEGSVEDRMKKFEDKSNPFDKFWKEFIEEDGSAYIFKYDFERKFNDWCRDNRFREFSETTIGLKMKDRGVDTIRRDAEWLSDGLKRKALRAWAGITWKDSQDKKNDDVKSYGWIGKSSDKKEDKKEDIQR